MIDKINNTFKNYKPYISGWDKFKRASVTIPLIHENDELHILFQVRSSNLSSNPNEVCFPGGKIEIGETPEYTAIRETCEELGITKEDISVICPLDIFVSPFNVIIHPYLVTIDNYDTIAINPSEVAEIFLVPLDYILNVEPEIYLTDISITPKDKFPYEKIQNNKGYKFSKGQYEIPFYVYNQYIIWGITAKILQNFIDAIKRIDII